MPGIYGTSGPGYARANMSPWDAAGGAMPAGGAVGGGAGLLSSVIDPNLIREAMLQGLEQRRLGFEEWRAGKQQGRKLAAAEEGRTAASAKEGKRERRRARSLESRERYGREPIERGATERAVARDVSQTQAMTGRVPTRMSTIGGQTFATPDPLRMTGAQRGMFLPQGASLSGGPGRMELAGLSSDVAFDAMLASDRARRREAAPTGY